ncbi:MAG: hypothetical protein HXX09_16755 [Bacteroidetes bacterium]|nr:hypothetical protein [Bacteroidota bacterium]
MENKFAEDLTLDSELLILLKSVRGGPYFVFCGCLNILHPETTVIIDSAIVKKKYLI